MLVSRHTHSLRLVMLALLIVLLALICATLPAALRWELVRFSSDGLKETNTITSEDKRIYLRVWPGGMWAKDALNLSVTAVPMPFLIAEPGRYEGVRPALNDGLPTLLPHRAWNQMIAESNPTSGDFVNLQAWGFPCRALAGGFVNGTNRRVGWYWEFTQWGQSFTIPTRPIWSGIAINTVFYAALILALLWLLRTLAHKVARWLTARRVGLCPHCRYDRSGLARDAACPECGTKPVLV